MEILYCDNSTDHLNYFQKIFNECSFDYNLKLCSSTEMLLSEENSTVSVFILDIDLDEELNGLDYAKCILERFPEAQIIYLTAYTDKYVEEAFINNKNVCAFLKKPVSPEILKKALDKAVNKLYMSSQTITIKPVRKKLAIIKQSDILYIETNGPKLDIVTTNEIFTTRDKAISIIKYLSPAFVYSHKSYIVNMNYISSLSSDTIHMTNGANIPISLSRRNEFTECYIKFMLQDKESCYD